MSAASFLVALAAGLVVGIFVGWVVVISVVLKRVNSKVNIHDLRIDHLMEKSPGVLHK